MKIDATYLDQINEQIQQLETTMSQPEVSSDPNKMKQCMREYAHTFTCYFCIYLHVCARVYIYTFG